MIKHKTPHKTAGKVMAVFLCVMAVVLPLTILIVNNSRYFDIEQPLFDVENKTNIAQWKSIPLVSQDLLDAGFQGGEGCQRLVGLGRSATNPNLMFLGTDVGGLFKSTDGGLTWHPSQNGIDRRGVGCIVVDPRNANHVVVTATTGGQTSSAYFSAVYYSFDAGETWHASGNLNIGVAGGHYFYDTLTFDADSYDADLGYCTKVFYSTPYLREVDKAGNLIDADKAGLYASTDGGKSFTKYTTQDQLYDGMMVVTNGRVLLGNQHGIFREENNHTFTKLNDLEVQSLVAVNDQFYALTEAGIYQAWSDFNFQLLSSTDFPAGADRCARSLAVSAIDPNHMVISAKKYPVNKYSDRIYVTHDGGDHWELINLGDKSAPIGMFFYFTWGVSSYSFNNQVPGEIVGTTANAVIRSSDYGRTWHVSNDGVANAMVGGKFNFNIYDENLVYFGIQDFGGALTTDGGKTWQNVSLSKDGDGKNIYGGYAVDKDTLIGIYSEQWSDGAKHTNERYVCFSHDGGQNVNIRKEDLTDETKVNYLKQINISNKIYTSYESSYQSPTDRNVLFCGNFRSTDKGHTWVNMLDDTASEAPCLQVYTHYGKTLYGVALGAGYVLQSTNDGKTWQKVNQTALAGLSNHIIDLAVDGKNGYIYAIYGELEGNRGKKLWRMRTDGTQITNLNPNIQRTDKSGKDNWGMVLLNTVAVDPNHPEIVYCGGSGDIYLSNAGVRRSCDFGETWQVMTPSAHPHSVVTQTSYGYETKCLRVAKTGEVWNGTSCFGFSKLTPPYESSCHQKIPTVKVYFHLGYDRRIGVYTSKAGRFLPDIYTPENTDDCDFAGWFTDPTYTTQFTFGTTLTQSIHLYAKWQQH